jgi:hypothetical protein
MKGKIKFINSKDLIPNATEEELRNVLITCDGAGEKQKTLVLNELLSRITAQRKGEANGLD